MAGTVGRGQKLTTQSAGRGTRHPQSMSGFTPRTGDDSTGLQDVLAFIADFEMEDNAAGANNDGDEWTDMDVSTTGKADQANLEEFAVHGGRRPTIAATIPSTRSLLPRATSPMGLPSCSSSAGDCDSNFGAVKTPRRHRVSRKEELEYLRKKVTEMEDKLKHLKDHAEDGGSPPSAAPATPEDETAAMKLEQSIALWKKMAERQKSQRELVESENSKLREKLKTQVRMAKSLQRILRKRERAGEQVTAETPKRVKQLTPVTAGGEFDMLVQNLDALYGFTNDRMAVCPMVSGAQPVIREQDVKYNDFAGMFLEFQNSKLVPFDLNAVDRAIWRHMSVPGMKFNTYFEEQSAEARENMILRKFGVEIKQDYRVAKMSGKQAIRRYVQNQRVVIVRNALIDRVEISDTATAGLAFRDLGWIVLQDVTGQFTASGPMTLIQSYSTITPDVDLDAQWEVGTLTDFVLQSREEIEVGNESIVENLLLEEATKRM